MFKEGDILIAKDSGARVRILNAYANRFKGIVVCPGGSSLTIGNISNNFEYRFFNKPESNLWEYGALLGGLYLFTRLK